MSKEEGFPRLFNIEKNIKRKRKTKMRTKAEKEQRAEDVRCYIIAELLEEWL